MVRVSSRGNPWHDEGGKFCSKENAVFIKSGGKFISCADLTIKEKDKLAERLQKQNNTKFYDAQSNKRLEIAKAKSIFVPEEVTDDMNKSTRIRVNKRNIKNQQKALKKFMKENKYHLEHGGKFVQWVSSDKKIYFACINTKRLAKETTTNKGVSIDLSTGMKAFDGHMVAKYNERSKWINGKISEKQLANIFTTYINNNLEQLTEKNSYFGTWYCTETNQISIDIAEQINNKEKAIQLGTERNEKAIWDVKAGKEISTGGTGTNI